MIALSYLASLIGLFIPRCANKKCYQVPLSFSEGDTEPRARVGLRFVCLKSSSNAVRTRRQRVFASGSSCARCVELA